MVTSIKTPSKGTERWNASTFEGISARTTGAKKLSMELVSIPPGVTTEPPLVFDNEIAVYILEGRGETRYGPTLEQSVINETGDFLFILPGIPHK